MRAILQFLYGLRLVFLFIALELISFALIIKNNAYHKAGFNNSSNAFIGTSYEKVTQTRNFFKLRQINDSLAVEIAHLQGRFLNKTFESSATTPMDSQAAEGRFAVYQAKVVNNTINYRNNYLTLNKGSRHGIAPRMAVISNNAVVGIVKDVSANYATAISILNSNARLSGKIHRNNAIGTIKWPGIDYREVHLLEIPTHIDVFIDDSVVTSEYSNIFPGDIMIGLVTEVTLPVGSSTYLIKVKLSKDFKRLAYVQVVGFNLQAERDSLEGGLSYE